MELHERGCGETVSYRALWVRPWKWGVPVSVQQMLLPLVGMVPLTLATVDFSAALLWTPMTGFVLFQLVGSLYRKDPWGPDLWLEEVRAGFVDSALGRSSLGVPSRPWDRPRWSS